MKLLKTVLFVACVSLFSSAFAVNMHLHPKAEAKPAAKGVTYPGYCEIEIINDSYTDLRVYGTFDDGSTVDFNVYRYEYPHYISLFYNFYCHSGMYITIQSPFYTVYSGWTNVNSTVRIVPYLKDQAKAQVTPR